MIYYLYFKWKFILFLQIPCYFFVGNITVRRIENTYFGFGTHTYSFFNLSNNFLLTRLKNLLMRLKYQDENIKHVIVFQTTINVLFPTE